jgi:hypothetical protein
MLGFLFSQNCHLYLRIVDQWLNSLMKHSERMVSQCLTSRFLMMIVRLFSIQQCDWQKFRVFWDVFDGDDHSGFLKWNVWFRLLDD